MNLASYIIRLLYRIRYWLIIVPILAALLAIFVTKHMQKEYTVSTTIFTGIASGYTIESGSDRASVDWGSVNNEVDNLTSVIKSKATLKRVSIRLYAEHMIYGDSLKDNSYIKASNYRALLAITPKEVLKLIDKTSEDKTIENLHEYEKATKDNFVYGLFNWFHRHYSYSALNKIDVKKVYSSDMLFIEYSADDPGIAYRTLAILNEEFVRQYEFLRFGGTNDVVAYFRGELAKLAEKLRSSEDSLTQYYIEKKIINYFEQTKIIASLSRDYDLTLNEILRQYTSSQQIVDDLEKKIEVQVKILKNNTEFVEKINNLSVLSADAARIRSFQKDSLKLEVKVLDDYDRKIRAAEDDIRSFSSVIMNEKYSKDGIASSSYVELWLEQLIIRQRSFAELGVMEDVIKGLEAQYVYFSPIGSTLKRKEREINITEQSYLSILSSLNTALMRLKNLQMSSATLKPIDPPSFPLYPNKSIRKTIVLVTFIGTFFLILGLFILLEIFDMTVRDKDRAERIIPVNALAAYPKKELFRYKAYNGEYNKIAINYIANSLVPFFNPKENPDIINFISTYDNVGKSDIIEHLKEYWEERGLRVRVITWHDALSSNSRGYILSTNLSELYDVENEDIILVEHKSLLKSAIPVGLLREASINLLVVRADKVWRDIDKLAFNRLKDQVGDVPLNTLITRANKNVTETFVGLLPPKTPIKKFIYKIIQLGLTSN